MIGICLHHYLQNKKISDIYNYGVGYYLYESLIFKTGFVAAAGMVGNITEGIVGVAGVYFLRIALGCTGIKK